MIPLVAGCSADPKPSPSAGSGEQRASTVDEKAPSDETRVRGHWICVSGSVDGEPETAPEGCHAVFTDKELKLSSRLGAQSYEFHFYPQSQPKRCDLARTKTAVAPLRAIYSLEDGKLRLCMASDINATYPTSFAPGKGRMICTYKRVEEETRINEASQTPQQKVALADQRKEMAENITRLEEKKYLEFIEHFFPPEVGAAIKQHNNGTEEMHRFMEELAPSYAQLLRALSNEVPTFSADTSRATYDVRAIHFNGLPPVSVITLVKIDGRWHMDNSTHVGQGK
jgi:uncharacterized protein (TIGR03067 family)